MGHRYSSPSWVFMRTRRFLSLSLLATIAIAGGLFVSDRQTVDGTALLPARIATGDPLRLGVLLPQTPALQELSQAMTSALFLLRDQVNSCGGINQAPVFLVMQTPEGSLTENPLDLEAVAMKTLIRQQGVHGAIATLTTDPDSHELQSTALDMALEARLPIISPLNTQTLATNGGRLDRFPFEPPTLGSDTNYWARTIPSDRQYLMAMAQFISQQGWTQIMTVVPDTPRGQHLEQVVVDVTEPTGGLVIQSDEPVRYSVANSPGAQASAYPVEFTAEPTIFQDEAPDVIVLMLEPTLSPVRMRALMEILTDAVDLTQTPVVLGNLLEVNHLLDRFDRKAIAPVGGPYSLHHVAPPPPLETISQVPAPNPNEPPAEEFTPHLLTGLWGLFPSPQKQAWQRLYQTWMTHLDTTVSPIAPYAWDAAALMMLAAEAAGSNHKLAIQSELRNIANPPGIEVTDVCQGLEHLRQGEMINYQGISGQVDLDGWGNVNTIQEYDVWQISAEGQRQTIDVLQWFEP